MLHKTQCCDVLCQVQGRNGGRTLRVYCPKCHKLQDTYRTTFINWTESDLEQLDSKFDALTEYLGLEFLFERISDGSKKGDRSTFICRKKLS